MEKVETYSIFNPRQIPLSSQNVVKPIPTVNVSMKDPYCMFINFIAGIGNAKLCYV
jgi:hypothetical protein